MPFVGNHHLRNMLIYRCPGDITSQEPVLVTEVRVVTLITAQPEMPKAVRLMVPS